MSKILKMLHVGVSGRGTWPIRLAKPENGYQSVGLVDLSEDALAAARELSGLPESACFHDMEEALNALECDCVVICTPTKFHVPLAKAALKRGIPALVEKGMAPNYEEALDLVNCSKETGVPFAVAQNYRYFGLSEVIWRAVHDESADFHLGRVFFMNFYQSRVRPNPRTLTYPYAAIWDMSCHHLDNFLYWFGPVKQLTAFEIAAPWSQYPYPNNNLAELDFANGTHVHYFHGHDASRIDVVMDLHGEKGALVLRDGTFYFNERPLENFGVTEKSVVETPEGSGELGVLKDFHKYVTTGEEPGISGPNNLEVMAMCQMFVRSIEEKRTIGRTEL